MIKEYKNGVSFIEDNNGILKQNPYLAAFFYLDAKEITSIDQNNYAFKVIDNKKTLLAMKLNPYGLLLFGHLECLEELLTYLHYYHYNVNEIMCETFIGDYLVKEYNYSQEIGMDFMEAKTKSHQSNKEISIPTIDDVTELASLMHEFHIEAGVTGNIDKDKIIMALPKTRVIKKDGRIASFARYTYNTETSDRISYVYTRPEYRGIGYARMIVGAIQNEIIDSGKIATLNVDQKNPISNHLYASLGFKKVYSQGVYLLNNRKDNQD